MFLKEQIHLQLFAVCFLENVNVWTILNINIVESTMNVHNYETGISSQGNFNAVSCLNTAAAII